MDDLLISLIVSTISGAVLIVPGILVAVKKISAHQRSRYVCFK